MRTEPIRWAGKTIGGLLGFAAAGPLGSVLGVLLGHQFDLGFGARFGSTRAARAPRDTQALFFAATFEVMGHLAKADGRISEEEIRIARRIMHAMHLSPEEVRAAIDRFYAGKRADYPLAQRLADLAAHLGTQRGLARAFVEIQMQAMIGAGSLAPGKRALLWQVAQALDIGRVELAQIEALIRAHEFATAGARRPPVNVDDAYRVLGVEPEATDKEVTTAYRRLMNLHHPDKLLARGLPESMAAMSERKTREIRAAYERIKAQRGLR